MEQAKPQFAPNGDVRVPSFVLPVSGLVSEEAAAAQRRRATVPPIDTSAITDIAERRKQAAAYAAPGIERLRARYPVEVTPITIAGVAAFDIRPSDGGHDPDRVLINLHGGGFVIGWPGNALIESIPLAVMSGYRILTLDYRMAPEHRHPAALEDVAAVYAALLADHAPARIGLYGGSAGGLLAAQAAAWFPRHGLPQVAALGVFGAGGVPFQAGESAYLAGYIDGEYPPPSPAEQGVEASDGYFAGVDARDPSAWPAYHPDLLAQFPPTLLITGTRSMDLSPAIYTNSQLIKAGVRSTLIVGESMGHCYYYNLGLPEAQDAYAAITAFFRENLSR